MSEAFVYCWTDHGRDMLYIGAHKGSPDGRYVCSSDIMIPEHDLRPQDFTRGVIASGSWKEMFVFEQTLIKASGAVKDPHYYNQAHSEGPFYHQGPHSQKTKDKIAVAQKKSYTPERRAQQSAATKNSMTPERRVQQSAATKKLWTSEYRTQQSAAQKKSWTPERRAQQSARQTGTTHSPEHTAKSAASQSCDYQIGWPDGHEEIIRNLNAFCRVHELQQSNMVSVSKGRKKHHKGFRCRRIA